MHEVFVPFEANAGIERIVVLFLELFVKLRARTLLHYENTLKAKILHLVAALFIQTRDAFKSRLAQALHPAKSSARGQRRR